MRVVATERPRAQEFGLPGGVFISSGHVWASVTVPGTVRLGMDDFARKMIGRINGIELPGKGGTIAKGETLFTVQQGSRKAAFQAPISGIVQDVNTELPHHPEWLERNPYEKGWVCSIKPEHLSNELEQFKIGDKAAAWYHVEIARLQEMLATAHGDSSVEYLTSPLVEGQLEGVDDDLWARFEQSFLRA